MDIFIDPTISQHIQKQGKAEITLHGKMSKDTPSLQILYDNSKSRNTTNQKVEIRLTANKITLCYLGK